MILLPLAGFGLAALLAIAFVAVPSLRDRAGKGRGLLAGAVALFVLGIGAGTYFMVGQPRLAERAAEGLNTRDVKGLAPFLIERVRKYPNDVKAWRFLAQTYMAANDPADAAKALAKVIALTGKGDAATDAAYGEALVLANSGTVPQEAEDAFAAALAIEPRNAPARFYLGLARAQHGDRPRAIALWQSLLNDTPPTSPLHQMLVDRLAVLTAQGAGGAPDPHAMVAMLAARLKADPNDAPGWVRLMRAYTVLGETDKARQALADARKAFKGNADAQTAFATAAKALKLEP
ncbi:MAG TPA: tetratricopeptide repeat protein [Rhizomicrobium sp.]|nr:tetratricopeptide repeat protein [Rhizomicrobium sp.]